MKEQDFQEKYVVHFLTGRTDDLNYKEVNPNTVSPNFFVGESYAII